METLLASGAGPQSAAQAAFFMTRPERSVGIALRKVPAVQGARVLAQAVDILHDVDLAAHGPRAGPEHPESRPVTHGVGRTRLLDGRRHHHLAAGRRLELALGPDPARGPRCTAASRGTVSQHDEIKVTVTVQMNVVQGRGYRLDLTGAEYPAAGVEIPVLGVDGAIRRAIEVVRPDLLPRRRLAGEELDAAEQPRTTKALSPAASHRNGREAPVRSPAPSAGRLPTVPINHRHVRQI